MMTAAPLNDPPVLVASGPLLEGHPLAHFVYDCVSMRMLAVNQAALRRYGYSHAEFLALNRADLLLPADVPALHDFLAALPASALAQPQREWLERTRDGRVLHADVRGMAVVFEGRPARLIAVVDAGNRARLAADAGQARDLLAVAGRVAHLGGWTLALRSRRLLWSDQVCILHEVPLGTEYDLDAAARFYPGAAATTIAAAVTACAEAGVPFDLELPFVGARGTARWVRVLGAAVRDRGGRIVAVEGAQQDITERKGNALALEESRARLAALLSAIPDLWFVIDAEGRYAEVSDPAHPGLSAPWRDKVGHSVHDALAPEQARFLAHTIAGAHACGQPRSYHYEMTVQSGESRSFEGRCVPLSGGRTMLLIRDVTETVQLEQRFRVMADAVPIGIYMTDKAGACTYTNPAWQRLYGLSLQDSLGRGWAAVLHRDDRARVFAALAADTAAGRPSELEFRLQTAAGAEHVVLARASPLIQADGGVLGHVGTVVDVTQARQLEAAHQARRVAEEAGRQQAAFLSRMSHELRTPLNAILGFGQLLQQAPALAPERATAYADHVVAAGRHMLALVDDLLQLQRLEQGSLPAQAAPVDLAALLHSCADLLRPAASAAGMELVVAAAAGQVLQSDERWLRQMVLNLGSNAIKYGRTPQGSGRVVLAAEMSPQAACLRVSDEGPGMSVLQLQRLFKPFERLGQETGSVQGSGLGLVITRQLAHLLGGEVLLDSQPGRGTTATVRLPL